MRRIVVVALAVTVLSGIAYSRTDSQRSSGAQHSNASAKAQDETPFFCDRTALNPEQRKRQGELAKILRASVLGVQELSDGFEFEFSPDPSNYQALTEFTPLERACCPFFDISIRLDREGGKLWWRLTGREGVKAFVRADFSPWFKR